MTSVAVEPEALVAERILDQPEIVAAVRIAVAEVLRDGHSDHSVPANPFSLVRVGAEADE